jgi:DNA-binding winged helix-turn-helix (wHTH) protein/tetratricopeptide (TPR) repeat protein
MNPAEHQEPKLLWQLDELVVDPVRRIVLRDGEAVAVTPKALSILFVLLERQGEVVTKQELIERIWPDTFVTEANLTQNISSLRKALGESANTRRYIVTVPGRGYSLAALAVPLEMPEKDEAQPLPPAPAEPPSAAPVPASGPPSGVRRTVEMEAVPPAARPRSRLLIPAALVLAVLAAGGAVWLGSRRPAARVPAPVPAAAGTGALPAAAPAAQRSTVAVLGFRNLSGEKGADWLAPALAEMLTTEMAGGSKVRVISGENVLRARRSLSLPATDHLETADLSRLHSLLGADLVVAGAYLALGKENERRIRLDLRVLKIPEGDTVACLSKVGTETELFELIAGTGAELRQALGFAGLSEAEEKAVRALRPASTEAARLYTQGVARLRNFDPPGARDLLLEAEKADSGSALVHSALSQTWSVLGDDALAVAEARKARDLSASLAREDRLAIEARLQVASRAWGRASEIYRSLWAFFPDDLEYGLQLATSLLMAGRPAEAQTAVAALRRLPPPAADDPRIDLLEGRIASRTYDLPGVQRTAAAAIAKGRQSGESSVVAQGLVLEGGVLLIQGKRDEAVQRFQEAKRTAEKVGFHWVVGMALANLGVAYQSQGDLDGAERAHSESLAVAQRLGSSEGIASQHFTLATVQRERGDLYAALRLLDQAGTWYAEIGDRMMQARLHAMTASILSDRGDLTGALRNAERAVTLSRETRNGADEAQALQDIGTVLDLQDDLGQARLYHLRAFKILRDLGDPGRSAAALAASADVTARLGDLPGARRRVAHALTAEQGIGDRLGASRILVLLADLAYESGDLAAAQSSSREELRVAGAAGARSLGAAALLILGRSQTAAGDLEGAWRSIQEVVRADTILGEDLHATAARLELARVALAGGRAAEAVSLAREAADWYGARGMRGRQAGALAVLAEAQWRAGSLAEARQTAGQARAQAEKSADRALRIAVATRVARVDSAAGDAAAALQSLKTLQAAIAEAEKSGFVALGLEARLALGEIQLAGQDRRGLDTLARVRADAAARGFTLLARRASGPLQELRRLG